MENLFSIKKIFIDWKTITKNELGYYMFSHKVNTEKNIDIISHYIGSDALRNCQLLVLKNEVTVKLFSENHNFTSTLKYIEY